MQSFNFIKKLLHLSLNANLRYSFSNSRFFWVVYFKSRDIATYILDRELSEGQLMIHFLGYNIDLSSFSFSKQMQTCVSTSQSGGFATCGERWEAAKPHFKHDVLCILFTGCPLTQRKVYPSYLQKHTYTNVHKHTETCMYTQKHRYKANEMSKDFIL